LDFVALLTGVVFFTIGIDATESFLFVVVLLMAGVLLFVAGVPLLTAGVPPSTAGVLPLTARVPLLTARVPARAEDVELFPLAIGVKNFLRVSLGFGVDIFSLPSRFLLPDL
jgi:hypothetical protein